MQEQINVIDAMNTPKIKDKRWKLRLENNHQKMYKLKQKQKQIENKSKQRKNKQKKQIAKEKRIETKQKEQKKKLWSLCNRISFYFR